MQYDLIYADPPWRYSFSKSASRKIENQYETMGIEDIEALEIPAAKDCVLYLWATMPKLPEAMRVVSAWGFEYVTGACWDKEIIGMGYWFRGQHELLLVAKRGSPSPPLQSVRRSSVFRARRGRHSAKPECVAEYLESAHPDVARLEMFARRARPGWDVWGDQAPDVVNSDTQRTEPKT